jgi:hypothetical protein
MKVCSVPVLPMVQIQPPSPLPAAAAILGCASLNCLSEA